MIKIFLLIKKTLAFSFCACRSLAKGAVHVIKVDYQLVKKPKKKKKIEPYSDLMHCNLILKGV